VTIVSQSRDGDGTHQALVVAHPSQVAAYRGSMDEARRVLERLERIEALREAEAEPSRLLGELRALLVEGEAWLAAERSGVASSRDGMGGGAATLRSGRALAELGTVLDRGAAAAGTVTALVLENAGSRSPAMRREVVSEPPAV
jgi:hypothetical protein